jgi:type IX secretion system PorP/SprF family membrane protein
VTFERGSDGIPESSVDNIAPETQNLNLSTMVKVGQAGNQFAGFGLSFINDQVGFSARTSVLVNLNYKMALPDGNSLISAGVGLGFQQFGLKAANFKARDPNDPLIPQGTGSEGKFNLNAGLFYRALRMGPFEEFYAGFSITQLNGAAYAVNIVPQGVFNRKFVPHYFTVIGADYDMGNIVLEPSILFKYALISSAYKPQFDVNLTALISETFRGGVGYRQWGNADAISLLLGFKRNYLELGYSYDITISNVQTVSNGTHEIMVKYCIPWTIEPPERIPLKGVRDL